MDKVYVGLVFILNGVVSLFAVNLAVNIMEANDYYLYSIALTAASLLNAVFFQWLRIYLLRELPGKYKMLYFGSIKIIRRTYLFYFISVALSGLLILYLKNDFYAVAFAVAVLALFQSYFEIGVALLRSWQKLKFFFFGSLVRNVTWLLLLALVFLVKGGVLYFLIFFAIAYGVAGVVLHYFAKPSGEYLSKFEDVKYNIFGNHIVYLSVSVVISFLSLLLLKLSVSEFTGESQFIAWFDLIYLVGITPFLAVNYLYQTRMVVLYNAGGDMGRLVFYPLICTVVVVVFSVFLYFINGYFYFRFPEIELQNVVAISSAISLLGFKQNWLDHAFYLKRDYKGLMLSVLLALSISLLAYLFLNVSIYQLMIIYTSLLVCISIATNIKFIRQSFSFWFTILIVSMLIFIGGASAFVS